MFPWTCSVVISGSYLLCRSLITEYARHTKGDPEGSPLVCHFAVEHYCEHRLAITAKPREGTRQRQELVETGLEFGGPHSRSCGVDMIESGPPFQVLIMRDASRFSRRDGDEAFSELKAIAKAGVDIWFYHDGTRFEYGNFAANITGIVRAEMNAEFRRQIAKWTREAMERKAKAGHVTGSGRPDRRAIVDEPGHDGAGSVERRLHGGAAW